MFDFNKEQTAQSRASIEEFVKKTKPSSDPARRPAGAKRKKAPEYYE
jgi:hypothetical protein